MTKKEEKEKAAEKLAGEQAEQAVEVDKVTELEEREGGTAEQVAEEAKAAKPEEGEGKATVAEEGECGCEATLPENCDCEVTPIINVENKAQGPTFADKLLGSINEAGEVAAAAIVVGYKKAETFVKSEEFKQSVETTKKTTAAVAGGLYRGFGKLIKEVKESVKDARDK